MNTAGNEGGGLWNGSGLMIVDNVTIDGNVASGVGPANGGGGVHNNGGTLELINGTTITNNIAEGSSGSGGGILNVLGGTVSATDVTITGNSAERAGGGIEDDSSINPGTINLTNVTLDNNTVAMSPGNGGGLHITGPGNATIIGGTVNNNIAGNEGGGLWNGSGLMVVDNVVIDNNVATGDGAANGGGGIFNNGGDLQILNNTTITYNQATGTAASGGGLLSVDGEINITASLFESNSANRAGGAIEVIDGILTLENVDLIGNDVNGGAGTPAPGNGGGIHISGETVTTITGGQIVNNAAGREGGGLWNQTGSLMTVVQVTIDGNSANGADPSDGGGGIFNNGGITEVISSTISNNQATASNGGGIQNNTGTTTIMTSTLSGNTAAMHGGGIYNDDILSINASTIAFNEAMMSGGGVTNNSSMGTSLKNTIVSNNEAPMGNDVSITSGVFMSEDYNLIADNADGVFPEASNDIIGELPLLEPLANNGGPTQTHAIVMGMNSPVIDAGDPNDLFEDQRGEAIVGIRDIGAFETDEVLSTGDIPFANASILLYPNPATKGFVNAEVPEVFGSSIQLNIIEVGSGKLVQQSNLDSGKTEINTQGLASGVYVLQFISENSSETKKLIVR